MSLKIYILFRFLLIKKSLKNIKKHHHDWRNQKKKYISKIIKHHNFFQHCIEIIFCIEFQVTHLRYAMQIVKTVGSKAVH